MYGVLCVYPLLSSNERYESTWFAVAATTATLGQFYKWYALSGCPCWPVL